jgi:hypothetical protein
VYCYTSVYPSCTASAWLSVDFNSSSGGSRLLFSGATNSIFLKMSPIFWDIKPCSKQSLLPASRWLLAWLILRHWSWGDMLLRNVNWLSTDYTALYPEDRTLHNHCSENLKSYLTFLPFAGSRHILVCPVYNVDARHCRHLLYFFRLYSLYFVSSSKNVCMYFFKKQLHWCNSKNASFFMLCIVLFICG